MRLPWRCHFKRTGQPKRAFDEESARREAIRSGKKAYRCKFCERWHVGGHA